MRPLLPLLLLSACTTKPVERATPEDSEAGTIPTVADDDADANANAKMEPQVVRFIALGDGGEGNAAQYAVARAVKDVCDSKTDEYGPGCEFALYLGDNFYDDGVESIDDSQFETKFELPYAELSFPFYVVLGNHDYGETSLEFWRTPHQVAYSALSQKWTMPSEFYTKSHEHALFIGLDTNAIMTKTVLGDDGQEAWIRDVHATNDATWTIAFGHHPYISNGQHGNAGTYEGIPIEIPVVSGTQIKEFMNAQICGKVDLYISGHDHNRQWLSPTCGTEFIVSGAASKTTDLAGRGTPTLFEDDGQEGFLWVELKDNTLTGEFYTKTGVLDFTQSITK